MLGSRKSACLPATLPVSLSFSSPFYSFSSASSFRLRCNSRSTAAAARRSMSSIRAIRFAHSNERQQQQQPSNGQRCWREKETLLIPRLLFPSLAVRSLSLAVQLSTRGRESEPVCPRAINKPARHASVPFVAVERRELPIHCSRRDLQQEMC